MVAPNASGTLLLERPLDAPEFGECPVPVDLSPELFSDLDLDVTSGGSESVGSLLRAPGLALLAAVFLIEGYRWLGVIHVGTTAVGSFLFGTVGLALVALAAPWVALFLTSGRRSGSSVVRDLVAVVALATVVATGTALVVGGAPWRTIAGITDLILAATALGAVVLGERARRHTGQGIPSQSSGTR